MGDGAGRTAFHRPEVRLAARQPSDSAGSAEAIADRLVGIAEGLIARCADPAFVALAFPRPCDDARGIPRLAANASRLAA